MSDFKDLAEVFDPSLYLPINGKTYRIPAPDIPTGLRLTSLFQLGLATNVAIEHGVEMTLTEEEAARLKPTGDAEDDFFRCTLGPAYDEMVADGLSMEYVAHAANTAFVRWTSGAESAAAFWAQDEGAGAGKAATGRLRTQTRAGSVVASSRTASRTGTSKPARSTTAGKKKTKGRR